MKNQKIGWSSHLNYNNVFVRFSNARALIALSLFIIIKPFNSVFTQGSMNSIKTQNESIVIGDTLPFSPNPEEMIPKMSNSSSYGFRRCKEDYAGIVGLILVREPKLKKGLRKKPLSPKLGDIRRYASTYFPGYFLIDWRTKDDACSTLILLDKERKRTFYARNDSKPLPAMRVLKKLDPAQYPPVEEVYLHLLGLITQKEDKYEAIRYAPTETASHQAVLNYFREFDDMLTLKEENFASSHKEAACVRGIELLSDSTLHTFLEVLECEPAPAMQWLVDKTPCSLLFDAHERIPKKYQALFFEYAECKMAGCIDSKADYDFYNNTYRERGICLEEAVTKVVNALAYTEGIWMFINENQPLVSNFQHAIQPVIQNSAKTRSNLKIMAKVFDDIPSLQWNAEFALKNLAFEDIGALIEDNVYAEIHDFVIDRIFIRTANQLKWGYFYLNRFRQNPNQRVDVYLNVFALEVDTLSRYGRILDYLKEFSIKSISRIQLYWQDCNLKFYVAKSDEIIGKQISQDCFECVNDYESLSRYLEVKNYDGEDAFDKVYRKLTASELRSLYEKAPALRQKIGIVFIDKAETTGDIDWYLKKYTQEEFDRKAASERGIAIEAESHGKTAAMTNRIANHLLEFGPDNSLINRYISSDQMLKLLRKLKNVPWRKELRDAAMNYITPDNIADYDTIMGNSSELRKMAAESITKSIEQSGASLENREIPSVSLGGEYLDSIDLLEMKSPMICLNIEGDLEEGVEYLLEFPDRSRRSVFSNKNKVVFLPSYLKYVKVAIVNNKEKKFLGSSNSTEFSVTIFDCPASLIAQFKSVITNPILRKQYLESCQDIVGGDANWKDYERVLGSKLAEFNNEENVVDQKLKNMAMQTAKVYLNVARPYYTTNRFRRVLKNIMKYLDESIQEHLNS